MKILICEKGGSGKSTVAALLAESLQQECYRVLVVDAEEKTIIFNQMTNRQSN
jgi:CO dehydrogenase maturation factor